MYIKKKINIFFLHFTPCSYKIKYVRVPTLLTVVGDVQKKIVLCGQTSHGKGKCVSAVLFSF